MTCSTELIQKCQLNISPMGDDCVKRQFLPRGRVQATIYRQTMYILQWATRLHFCRKGRFHYLLTQTDFSIYRAYAVDRDVRTKNSSVLRVPRNHIFPFLACRCFEHHATEGVCVYRKDCPINESNVLGSQLP
jgi:hypothetical protein